MPLTWKKCEVRAVTKYLYVKGLIQQEIFCGIKETLSESALAYSTFAKWLAELSRGRSLCEDRHHRGRPATSLDEETVEKVNEFVMSDRRLLVCLLYTSPSPRDS